MPVYGNAAGGLTQDGATWAVNAQAAQTGAQGERRTAEILQRFAADAVILHDLRVPKKGSRANIDHVVVSGNRVQIIDTKAWKPGFYWSFDGVARRGWTKVPHTVKDQSWLTAVVRDYLKGTGAVVMDPVVAVWSSSARNEPSVWALRIPGARTVHASRLESLVRQFVRPAEAPDPAIVYRLGQQLTTGTRRAA